MKKLRRISVILLVACMVNTSVIPAFAEGIPEQQTETETANGIVPEITNPNEAAYKSISEDPVDDDIDEASPSDAEEADDKLFVREVTVDGVKIKVEAPAGTFPRDAELSVKTVDEDTVDENIENVEETIEEAVEAARKNDKSLKDAKVLSSLKFDIKIELPDGTELQPEGNKVKVTFTLAEKISDCVDINVYHLKEVENAETPDDTEESDASLTAEKVEGIVKTVPAEEATETAEGATAVKTVSEEEVDEDDILADGQITNDVNDEVSEFEGDTDGFSYYTVEFTYNELQYVLSGDNNIALSDILAELMIEGTVADVEVSSPKLFSADKDAAGNWTVTALQAFSSSEKMTVAMDDGKEYEITVTDDQIAFPKVIIHTPEGNGNNIVKSDGYVEGTKIEIIAADYATISEENGKIKVRGNSTSEGAKKPFNIKFAEKQNVLGMGKAKKWCLLANCFDPTLMRNYIGIHLAQDLGLEFTSEQRYVELWIDDVYKGCYILIEAVETGKTRVDIDTDDNDNEFLLELNSGRIESGVSYITAKDGVRFEISEPEEPKEEQLTNIQTKINLVADALLSGDYESVQSIVDTDSFCKMYLLNEYMKTVDFGGLSVYYYFKDGKMYCGPAWDFDLSSGNANPYYYTGYYSYDSEDSMGYKGLWAKGNPWISRLFKYAEFKNAVYEEYQNQENLFENVFSDNGLIDTIVDDYGELFERNYTLANWKVSTLYSGLERQPLSTFSENVDYMKQWFEKRYHYLQDALNPEKGMYYVYYVNYDNTVLKKSEIFIGDVIPQYNLSLPQKPSDGTYNYSFSSWSGPVSQADGSIVYTAQYTASFINNDSEDDGESGSSGRSGESSNRGGSSSGGSGGGSGSGGAGASVIISYAEKPAVTPITVSSNGSQMMGTAVVSIPAAQLAKSGAAPVSGVWSKANGMWTFTKADGNKAKNELVLITVAGGNASYFYFDSNGNMVTGWQQVGGKWMYFNNESGPLLGACLRGPGRTPDGYEIDAAGAWTGR
ncbi:MAG: CotH kinase family protein [Lachnospiraceae bacterium]|nr:CotH kinase family protein [Candidatus Darwinimomas equi]